MQFNLVPRDTFWVTLQAATCLAVGLFVRKSDTNFFTRMPPPPPRK
jgi:hypothetical protein